MATHSSVLAWRVPRMGEPGGLPSVGLHRVGHDWRDLAAAVAAWSSSKDTKVHLKTWITIFLFMDGNWAVALRWPYKVSANSPSIVKPLRWMCLLAQLLEARTSCSNCTSIMTCPQSHGLVWRSRVSRRTLAILGNDDKRHLTDRMESIYW